MSLSEVLTAYRRVVKHTDADEAHLYKLVLKMSMKKNRGPKHTSWTQIFADMRSRYKKKCRALQFRKFQLHSKVFNGIAYLSYLSHN